MNLIPLLGSAVILSIIPYSLRLSMINWNWESIASEIYDPGVSDSLKQRVESLQEAYATTLRALHQAPELKASTELEENDEIRSLRIQLVQHKSALVTLDDRNKKRQAESQFLNSQYDSISSELEAINSKHVDLQESRIRAGVNETQHDLVQGATQLESLRRDVDEQLYARTEMAKQEDSLKTQRADAQRNYENAAKLPLDIIAAIQPLRAKLKLIHANIEREELTAEAQDSELDQHQLSQAAMQDSTVTLRAQYEGLKLNILHIERELDSIQKDKMLAKENALTAKSKIVEIAVTTKKTMNEINWANESLVKIARAKDSLLQETRRQETMADSTKVNLTTLMNQYKDFEAQVDRQKCDISAMKSALAQERKQIDIAMFAFVHHHRVVKEETEMLEKVQARTMELEEAMGTLSDEVIELNRTTEKLKIECEVAASESISAKADHGEIQEQIRSKDIFIRELKKKLGVLSSDSHSLQATFETLRKEKSVILGLITITDERNKKCQAKLDDMTQELMKLTSNSLVKTTKLAQHHTTYTRICTELEAVRGELNRTRQQYRTCKETVRTGSSVMERLLLQIEYSESRMSYMRSTYHNLMTHRNRVAAHLVERNNELCLLYERHRLQDTLLTTVEHEILQRMTGIGKLQSEYKTVLNQKRKLENMRPEFDESMRKKDQLRRDLYVERNTICDLSTSMVSDSTTSLNDFISNDRCNFLPGADPSSSKLKERIQVLLDRLDTKEKKLGALLLTAHGLDIRHRQTALEVAERKRNNSGVYEQFQDVAHRLAHADRQTLALLSELSMYQAMSVKLESDKNEQDQAVTVSRAKFLRGEAPTTEIEDEWDRVFKNSDRRRQEVFQSRKSWKKLFESVSLETTQNPLEFADNGIILATSIATNKTQAPLKNST